MPAYFDLMGVGLTAGRFLTESDNDLSGGATAGAVISERLWRRVFGADSRAIGETFKVYGRPVAIVEVAAAGFDGLDVDSGVDVFLQTETDEQLGSLRARDRDNTDQHRTI